MQEERYTRKWALVPTAPSLGFEEREGEETENQHTPLPTHFAAEIRGGNENLPREETLAAADSVRENSAPEPQTLSGPLGGF